MLEDSPGDINLPPPVYSQYRGRPSSEKLLLKRGPPQDFLQRLPRCFLQTFPFWCVDRKKSRERGEGFRMKTMVLLENNPVKKILHILSPKSSRCCCCYYRTSAG